jgi:ABC-type lipoprotein release transport system permease subunit
MSRFRLILASLVYHWRIHLAVAFGVAVGTAVLTGALLVGDSMRGSLLDLTLDRLGRIDDVLLTGQFFRVRLAEELAREPEFSARFSAAVPAIWLRASLENPDLERPARASQVNLLGCPPQFWDLGTDRPKELPEGRSIVLNQPLAEQLGARVGDQVVLRLPRITTIPADSPLGRKRETVKGHRLTVRRILPAKGLGRFDLHLSQQEPRNAYLSLDWLADQLDQPGRANAILVAGRRADVLAAPDDEKRLQALVRPSLSDYGIRVEPSRAGPTNITSDRMLLEPGMEKAILRALGDRQVQPALTYLANTIACGDREIPYSTIAAVNFPESPSPESLTAADGQPIPRLAEGQIVLNRWAADDLQAKPGDTIRVRYFEPDSADGQVRESEAHFRLVAIAELSGAAADPSFTPEVPGVTDQASIADWDPPFPFDAKRIRKKDERYWDDRRATPKAFISLAEGRRLWGSRFGYTTSLRLASTTDSSGESTVDVSLRETTIRSRSERPTVARDLIVQRLEQPGVLHAAELGFVFQPVKRQGFEASAGTTPFSVLFLGFSFFLIAAAVMLVAILYRLGIEGRAAQVGALLAVGFSRRQVTWVLAAEGLAVAGLASLLGVAAGAGYAALMLLGLQTWWLEAVVTPFLRLHVSAVSLLLGYLIGLVIAVAAIAWSVRSIGRIAPRQLLTGQTETTFPAAKPPRAWWSRLPGLLLLVAIAVGLAALPLGEEARAGAFFGSGSMVLVSGLMALAARLRRGATGPAVVSGRGNLLRLALRNAARHPGRSTLTVGALAAASFLIVAVSAFHLDPSSQGPNRDSGNGGFALVAESDQPLYYDPNNSTGQTELGFSPEDSAALKDAKVYRFRVKPGEDASCLNLYRPRQPRILGVPADFIERGGFAFSAHRSVDLGKLGEMPPWKLLGSLERPRDPDGTPRVAMIVDEATAMYSLHLWNGVGETLEVRDSRGQPVRLEVVALLKNSIFQGNLLIDERAMRRYFPEVNGYRFFLVETPKARTALVNDALQRTLGDYGWSAETTGRRLARLMAVQNTYLSTFQTLGGLGLLLGTLGLAAVELRNVLERRRELALLRAVGFSRTMIARLVMIENSLLLILGLACGLLAASVAVLPHYLTGAASLPWRSSLAALLAVLLVGLLAGLVAVRAAVASPLLTALRED